MRHYGFYALNVSLSALSYELDRLQQNDYNVQIVNVLALENADFVVIVYKKPV